jgi:NAD-dependent dihydropyrimidine dehydrogenase PreA subunit
MTASYWVCEVCHTVAPAGLPGWQEGEREKFEFPSEWDGCPLIPDHVIRCPEHAIIPISKPRGAG